jgi:hypothetical protein
MRWALAWAGLMSNPPTLAFFPTTQALSLMAVMARQAGKKYVPFVGRGFASVSKWGQIEQNMDYWTAKWRKRLDTAHGKSGETAAKAGS